MFDNNEFPSGHDLAGCDYGVPSMFTCVNDQGGEVEVSGGQVEGVR